MFDLGLGSSHALVTGASGGIGLATVQAFLDQDALVSAHYNSNSQSLADAFGSNERVCAVKASIESEEEVTQMFADSRKKLGKAVNMLVGQSREAASCHLLSFEMPPVPDSCCIWSCSQPRLHRSDGLSYQGHALGRVAKDYQCQPDRYGPLHLRSRHESEL